MPSLIRIRALAILLLVSSAASALHAQLPTDKDVWKSRCRLLVSQSHAILAGTTPPALISATQNVPGAQFYVLAVNRGQAGEHWVACTVYYLAAIAARNGNDGSHDYKAAKNDVTLGSAEYRLAHHQHLLMDQHLKRAEMRVENMGSTLTLNQDQIDAVLAAATTTPITLAPVAVP